MIITIIFFHQRRQLKGQKQKIKSLLLAAPQVQEGFLSGGDFLL